MSLYFKFVSIYVVLQISLSSCSGPKKVIFEAPPPLTEQPGAAPANIPEPLHMDNLIIPNENGIERYSATRFWDLLHFQVALQVDIPNQTADCKAHLKLKPYAYAQSTLTLDAKGFLFRKCQLLNGTMLTYQNDSAQVTIQLDKTYAPNDSIQIVLEYQARPTLFLGGGSAAITGDQGLYFINYDGSDKTMPRQIWTQGETESNSRWVPCIDKPNERCTGEIILTIPDTLISLSNGELISSKKNANGTRTDHWSMRIPMAPYLYMFAASNYSVTQDQYKQWPITYYVDPPFAPYAKEIYKNTGEIMEFFSQFTGVPYPWGSMRMAIANRFVSGAMENTGAILFGNFIQKTPPELIEDSNDDIIAHEIFHHWFGNLVTPIDWSNLVLNEGFANYGEFLWKEYKYGRTEADYSRMNEFQTYYNEATYKIRPLIDYHYAQRDDMFDRHSYNKGGLTWHMLREYLGTDIFQKGLRTYLTRHAFQTVQVDQLRIAMEEVSGRDLRWWFEQWLHTEGHPILNVDYEWNADQKQIVLNANQVQERPTKLKAYRIPTSVEIIHADGTAQWFPIEIKERNATFQIPCMQKPKVVIFDPGVNLVGEVHIKNTDAEWTNQFEYATRPIDRIIAASLIENKYGGQFQQAISKALHSKEPRIQLVAIQNLNHELITESDINQLKVLAQNSTQWYVQEAALMALTGKPLVADIAKPFLNNPGTPPSVRKAAIELLASSDPIQAEEYVMPYLDKPEDQLFLTAMSVLATKNLDTFKEKLETYYQRVNPQQALGLFVLYGQNLSKASDEKIQSGLKFLEKVAKEENQDKYYRLSGTAGLAVLIGVITQDGTDAQKSTYEPLIKSALTRIKESEKDPELKEYYKEF